MDTLTLSVEQKTLTEERIGRAGLGDRVRVHLLDYRKIPADFEKAFDAFVSIEMIEVSSSALTRPLVHEKPVQHIGPEYYNTYFHLVDFALKSKDATVVITSSTLPQSRYANYQ